MMPSLLRLEHDVSEAGLIVKANLRATLRRGQGVPGVHARGPAGERGGRNQKGSENPSSPSPHEAAVPWPALGPHFSWRHQSVVLTRLRGARRNLVVGSPLCKGARPRRAQQKRNDAPHYNLPAGTSFRLLTDGARGSGSPAYGLDATDATPDDSSFNGFFGGKRFPF
ncbi:hypothetical protein I79_012719 [Cricetulus griseus]|uniref:Uncharacterized protein n=1 Tax=Cricetulus griseus TaxID=10029 RepID=G3HPK5_CRIGR|nr:hypothetical protein I79_012719 [Cricetulus griseus]